MRPTHLTSVGTETVTLRLPEHLELVEIKGHSMEPTFRAGALVIVNRSETRPSPDGYYFVDTGVGEQAQRLQLFPGQPPTVSLTFDNTAYSGAEMLASDVRLTGRIVGVFTPL